MGLNFPTLNFPPLAFCRDSLEILVFDELNDDVFLWLDLQHLQREAEEGSGLDVPAVNASNKLQLHGFVDNQLGCGRHKQHENKAVTGSRKTH